VSCPCKSVNLSCQAHHSLTPCLRQHSRTVASLPRRSHLTHRQVGPGITLQTPLWDVLDSSPGVYKAVMLILARWTTIEIYGFISVRKISRHVPLEFIRSVRQIHYHESHGRTRTRWRGGGIFRGYFNG
jgi:hypothetical protein